MNVLFGLPERRFVIFPIGRLMVYPESFWTTPKSSGSALDKGLYTDYTLSKQYF